MPAAEDPGRGESAQIPPSLLAAVVVLALQAAAFAALGVILLVKAVTGHPHSLVAALLDALWGFLGAAILGQCARAMRRRRPAARTPVVVIELLALPVSYDLAFEAHRPEYGAPILISALAVLYLLFTPAARAALDRDR